VLTTKVKNTGQLAYQNLTLTLQTKNEVSFVSVSGEGCSGSGSKWRCMINSLAIGASASYKPKVKVNGSGKLTTSVLDSQGMTLKTKSATITV